jgi:hypothetical protein
LVATLEQPPTVINVVTAATEAVAVMRPVKDSRKRLGCVTGTSGLATKIPYVWNTASLQTSEF